MRRSLPFVLVLAAALLHACAPEGPSAFVTSNLLPDDSCVYSPTASSLSLFVGLFDVGELEGACAHAYRVHLLVNSQLRSNADGPIGRAEPNVLQVHSAKVKLMALDGRLITIPEGQPNPFLTNSSVSVFPSDGDSPSLGIASVEVVPSSYRAGLEPGVQIKAEIQLFGTTTGDVEVEFKPFTYNIDLCGGCLHVCSSTLDGEMTAEDVQGEGCADNSGSDGRVCIDPGC